MNDYTKIIDEIAADEAAMAQQYGSLQIILDRLAMAALFQELVRASQQVVARGIKLSVGEDESTASDTVWIQSSTHRLMFTRTAQDHRVRISLVANSMPYPIYGQKIFDSQIAARIEDIKTWAGGVVSGSLRTLLSAR